MLEKRFESHNADKSIVIALGVEERLAFLICVNGGTVGMCIRVQMFGVSFG